MGKRVTLKQIADEIGVSMMTVSRALNNSKNVEEKTREKILKIAHEMGYFPNHIAKSLVQRRTQTIGVVVPEIAHSFFPEAIRGIDEVAYNAGYQLMLTHSAEDFQREKGAIETLVAKRVDGLLVSISQSTDQYEIFERVTNHGIPVVFFDRCIFGIGSSCVGIDDEASAKEITEHLIKQNYKKIAHLSGPLTVSIGKGRLNGYRAALKAHSIPYNPDLVIESGFQEQGGYTAMQKLLSYDEDIRPDAIVAVNDPAAFGAMKAILEAGFSIPDDFAIIGFSDDIRAKFMPVPLTTVEQPAYEVGRKAAEKLINHIERKHEKVEEITIDTKLIVRNSCGANKNISYDVNGKKKNTTLEHLLQ